MEIMIGLALIVLGIGSATILVFGGQKILIDRGNAIQARNLAEEGLDAARSIRERDWSELTDGEHGLVFGTSSWAFSSSSDTDGFFTRKIVITTQDENTKKVESKTTWIPDPLRTLNVELVTFLTNWENATPPPDPGDTGSGGTSGDWQNPQTLGSVDLGPGNSATDLDVISSIIYMSAEAAATAKPDFFIIDATNGQNPFIVSSLNTGPSLNAIDATVNYAYVANRQADAELQIIDISNLLNPTLIASYAAPGVSGSSRGETIFYSGDKVYLGLNKVIGPEFHIIDVSNPASPTNLGSYEVNDNINDIYVRDNKAYLATDLGNAGLMVLNVSNPAEITLLGQKYSVDTNAVYVENPAVLLLGPAQDIYIVEASNPSDIITLGTLSIGDVVNDIASRGNLAFIASSNSNREFQVVSIASSTNPTLWSSFNFPQVATGIDYENNLVYVAVRSNDALRIITSPP
ncbi:MAG: hypothetical protein UY32_C0008G0005 [Candidatus Jorgensenbacteria bacterium GW2011_GWC1_48_8]|uniref:LVIVD repeat protein n=1 Tax=Candidatus Jorgensenbacteria bacterium GW2011_GWC1_48_8 TaxID=1618666 RepID=A0A0G1UXP5_9BACT|nr:MAG: hypothetical protein UY32_C0008G0005 [Candidatus Jorgensenbacteria bacterium GW2011_GWC1_48_8]